MIRQDNNRSCSPSPSPSSLKKRVIWADGDHYSPRALCSGAPFLTAAPSAITSSSTTACTGGIDLLEFRRKKLEMAQTAGIVPMSAWDDYINTTNSNNGSVSSSSISSLDSAGSSASTVVMLKSCLAKPKTTLDQDTANTFYDKKEQHYSQENRGWFAKTNMGIVLSSLPRDCE